MLDSFRSGWTTTETTKPINGNKAAADVLCAAMLYVA
jgi:hypothetical protein